MTSASRRRVIPLAYDPSENPPREPKRRRESGLCPMMYHRCDNLTTTELSHVQREARDLELTSESLLNLIVSLHRRGDRNSLISLLDFLESLR